MKAEDFLKNERKKRKQMRTLLGLILFLVVMNLVFDLNFPHWVWIVSFIFVCVLSLIQVIDKKDRWADERLKKLENKTTELENKAKELKKYKN